MRPHEYMLGCPAHDEKTGSLHVTWRSSNRGGFVLLHCFGCQARGEDLVAPLGLTLADLFDEPMPERDRAFGRVGKSPENRRAARRRGHLGRLPAAIVTAARSEAAEPEHVWVEVERYAYVDLRGQLVQEVVREECSAEGATHKQFTQVFVTGTGRKVRRKPQEFFPVLYRAPQVRAAIEADVPVWLLEGEKDVHTAERLGLVATTNAQGGRSFPDELIDCFEGARVIVVLDRDETGWARGVELHRKLTAVGAKVSLKLPAVEAPKADFTDHVEANHDVEALVSVDVLEVATWHQLSGLTAKRRQLEQALTEADAHLALVEQTQGATAEEHRRCATRWVMEAQIRHEALKDLVDKVHGQGLRVGTVWVGEAMVHADQVLAAATESTRRAHVRVGAPVPPSLRLAVTATPAADPDGGGGAEPPSTHVLRGAGDEDPEEAPRRGVATTPVFRVLGGQIVQWNPPRNRRGDSEDEEDGDYKTVLSTVVKVTAREYLEETEAADVATIPLMGRASPERKKVGAPRTLLAVRIEYPDPVTGELMEIRIDRDTWSDRTWLKSLPGPVDYDHRRSGLDVVERAIWAVSDNVVDEVLFRATGWRCFPDGQWRFVHARGAIGPGGHQDVRVQFDDVMRRYDLPDPLTDTQHLRALFLEHSAGMLDRLPDRVAAPLLGQVYRSVLGHNPWVLSLIGAPGSYKTSVASKAMHHLGEKWEHSRPGSSMSGNGDTFNALRWKLYAAKDTLYWADDFAPTKSWIEAQKHLEESTRLVHNQEERGRSSRDGQSIFGGTPPRASALFTSEVMPRPGSGAERMLVVPLWRGDVDTSLLFPLDEPDSRYGRAAVMSSFLQWLAGDLQNRRTHYLTIADEYARQMTNAGQSIRAAAALSQMWIGWVAMADFLTEAGALSAHERRDLLIRVNEALIEAGGAAHDQDLPRTTGGRVRELLQFALRQGLAFVDDARTGDCPPWPLAGQLGWRRQVIETDQLGNALKTRVDRLGTRLGYVMHDPGVRDRGRVIMCPSAALEAVIKTASATQAEQLHIDRTTALRALADEDVVLFEREKNGKMRFTLHCNLPAEDRDAARMVVLRLDRLIDEDEDGQDCGAGPDGDDDAPGGRTAPVPGLPGPSTEHDPHRVDDPQQADVASENDEVGDQEETMREPQWTSRPVTDAAGEVGWTERRAIEDVAPCIVCGMRCGVVIAGQRCHGPCWERTTADQRAGGATPAAAASTPRSARPEAEPVADQAAPIVQRAGDPQLRTIAGGTFRAAAAVVDEDGIWLSNGEHLPMPGQGPSHLGDLMRLAQWLQLGTQTTKYLSAPGQVWVGDRLARRLGIDVETISAADETDRDKVAREVTRSATGVREALAAGYSLSGGDGDALGRWTRIWTTREPKQKGVWLVLRAALGQDQGVPLVADAPDHATLARRIGLLADALGQPFQLSGSTTGLDLMTALRWKDRDRFFQVLEPCPPAEIPNVETDISWCRQPTPDELSQHRWVHAYDRSGSYLAGVAGLELGVGVPQHHPEGTVFQPRIPGYWRIEIPNAGDWRVPNPLDPRGVNAGKIRWVTTPALEFAREQDYDPQVLEAYTWAEHARVLDPWYERIRDARIKLDVTDPDSQIARDQLKAIYAPTIGMLGSKIYMANRRGYAPDRRHMIIAKARTNILRRVAKIGQETDRWPVAIIADTVLYTSADPDPTASWPGAEQALGRELGRYKVEGSARLEDHLPHLTGGTYKGKDAIVARTPGGE
jgi:hypothetical protein